jgi:hypothetical protein
MVMNLSQWQRESVWLSKNGSTRLLLFARAKCIQSSLLMRMLVCWAYTGQDDGDDQPAIRSAHTTRKREKVMSSVNGRERGSQDACVVVSEVSCVLGESRQRRATLD